MLQSRLLFIAIMTSSVFIPGCGDSDPTSDMNPDAPPTSTPDGGADAGVDAGADAGTGTDAIPAVQWQEIRPGGETSCARGGEYSFFYRPGTVNKVVVEFLGGGACWDAQTCSAQSALFVGDMEGIRGLFLNDEGRGLLDHNNDQNPVKDWHHVIVPYCTGDIHWGNSEVTYGQGDTAYTIQHRGAVNARAVLDWVKENFATENVDDLLISGCSGGAYGAIVWAPYLIDAYPDAHVAHFGDSGAGVVPAQWLEATFAIWNAAGAFPSQVPGLDPAEVYIPSLILPEVYARIGTHYPDVTFSQFNNTQDEGQAIYLILLDPNATVESWSQIMRQYVDQIESAIPNFHQYRADGMQHCVMPQPNVYEVEVNGIAFLDWFQDLLDGTLNQSVICEGC